MPPLIVISNYDALMAMDKYIRKRFNISTRVRVSDSRERLDALRGLVTTDDGRDCVLEWETICRVLPRVAILSEPWIQNAESILKATIELYEKLISRMTYLRFLESSAAFTSYYYALSPKGRTMNKKYFSRRYMTFADLPIANIAAELLHPKSQGAMLFFHINPNDDVSNISESDKLILIQSTKDHLCLDFTKDDDVFMYEQMFDGNGKLTKYGDKNLNYER
jgi:hypothetical protein